MSNLKNNPIVTTEKSRVSISYSLHPYPLKEQSERYGWKQLKAEIRCYLYGNLKERFAILLYDGGQPLYINPRYFKRGQLKIEHHDSIRLNILLQYVTQKIRSEITDQLEKKLTVDKDQVRKRIKEFSKEFQLDLTTVQREFAPRELVEKFEYSRPLGEIDKVVMDDFLNLNETINLEDAEDIILSKQVSYNRQLENERIKKLPSKKRYELGEFNNEDIFQVYGSLYFDKDLKNRDNLSVVLRLFDYKENSNVKSKINLFDLAWCKDFFNWLNETGYYNLSSKGFDPLVYNPDIFRQSKPRIKYDSASIQKAISRFKVVTNQLMKKELLPNFNLDELTVLDYREQVDEAPRKKHYINKSEFDKWFSFKFDKKKEKEYQQLLPQLRKSEIIKGKIENDISIKTLTEYRDAFSLMIMIGGLRGVDEYNTIELIDYDDNGQAIKFFQNKTGLIITNPVNKFSKLIIEKYNGKLPKIKNGETLNAYLKVIGHIIGLNRNFENGELVNNIISGYWARKSFGNILFNLGVIQEHIILFTGHESKIKTVLAKSYLDFESIELKRKILKDINFL